MIDYERIFIFSEEQNWREKTEKKRKEKRKNIVSLRISGEKDFYLDGGTLCIGVAQIVLNDSEWP